MKMSKHATVRQQQRGIPPIIIDLLLGWGKAEIATGDDVTRYYFDKESRRGIKAHFGPIANHLTQYLDCYAVVSCDGKVITVAHQIRKFNH